MAAGMGQRHAVRTTVAVRDREGQPLPGVAVTVRQAGHAFGFGCIGFDAVALANDELTGDDLVAAEALHARWLDVFDTATLPFYWGQFEPVRGRPDTERLLRAARWFADQGLRVKGHPLCWHTETAPWLLALPVDEALAAQLARIRREVAAFGGTIDTWDVINEAVIMPVFDRQENGVTRIARELGRVETVRRVFAAARETNPTATLLINDFDLSEAYEALVEACLAAGVTIDAIGLQSHMHQGYWGEERTGRILERFARFGLPLHWTETTLLSGELMPPSIEDLNDFRVDAWPSTPEGEARQADEVARHYRTLFGHPAVRAITYWGLRDGGWLNAPGGLVRADGTPKPAYEALRTLVRDEWWLAPTRLTTDGDGVVAFEGHEGTYVVEGAPGSATLAVGSGGSAHLVARLGGATG